MCETNGAEIQVGFTFISIRLAAMEHDLPVRGAGRLHPTGGRGSVP